MKKLCFVLAFLLAFSLTACGKDPSGGDADFTWTREGYFSDGSSDLVYISASEDEDNPGWYVGCLFEEGMYGWYIQQEGKTLHGDILSPYEEGGDPFVVTVSEEGEDGILLEIENGSTYHMTPYEIPEAAFVLTVNVDGSGQIAYAEGDAAPEFDSEYPMQSGYTGLESAKVYTFAAKPDEGYKFMKWTYNGSDYSADPQITFEVTEDVDLVAVFGIKGRDETHVDLDAVTALGQLLGLPEYGYTCTEEKYAYGFEQDGMIYRAVAQMEPGVFDAFMELDWEDEAYEEKKIGLISDLPVIRIDNLTEGIPSQEEMDQYVGMTGEELLNDGWYNSGWNLEDMVFYMDHGPYSYEMVMEGDVEDPMEFEEEDMYPLIVKSVSFLRIGDPAYLEQE